MGQLTRISILSFQRTVAGLTAGLMLLSAPAAWADCEGLKAVAGQIPGVRAISQLGHQLLKQAQQHGQKAQSQAGQGAAQESAGLGSVGSGTGAFDQTDVKSSTGMALSIGAGKSDLHTGGSNFTGGQGSYAGAVGSNQSQAETAGGSLKAGEDVLTKGGALQGENGAAKGTDMAACKKYLTPPPGNPAGYQKCISECTQTFSSNQGQLMQLLQMAGQMMQQAAQQKKKGEEGQKDNQANADRNAQQAQDANMLANQSAQSGLNHTDSRLDNGGAGNGLISSTINPVDNGLFADQAGETVHGLVGGDLTETSFDKLGGVGSYNSNAAGSGYSVAANGVKNAGGGGDGTTAGFSDDAEAFSASIGSATAPIDFGAMISGAMDGVGTIASSIGDFKLSSDSSSLDIGRALVPHLLQTFGADPAAMSDPQKKKPVPMEMLGFQPKNMLEVENRRTGRLLNWAGRIKLRYQYADPRGVPLVHGRGLLMAYYETLKTSNNPETTRALASSVGVTPPAPSTTR